MEYKHNLQHRERCDELISVGEDWNKNITFNTGKGVMS